MKSKTRFTSIATGGKLALALACTLFAGQALAVPYASLIRFGEPTLVGSNINVDLIYTINEDADEVTVEVYNNTTASVVRTYNFLAPATQTQRGRHTIVWDGLDDATNPVSIGGNEFVIRVNVKKFETTNEWTLITNNSSGLKATEQNSLFAGYSSMNIKIPTDPTTNQFGRLLVAHAWTGSYPAGVVILGTDLAPLLGNGGGFDNIKGRHVGSLVTPVPPDPNTINDQALWNMNFDPLDSGLLWWTGQSTPHTMGVLNISPLHESDIQANADVVKSTSPLPRGIAIGLNGLGDRVAYSAHGNQIDRVELDTTYPYAAGTATQLTAGTIAGITRYASDVQLDADGNLYFLSRLGGGSSSASSLWRWNKADVDAAPAPLLSHTNAAWFVTFPAGTIQGNALHVDNITGNVFVSANALASNPRGVWLVGNTSTPTLGTPVDSTPHVLSAADQILDFNNLTQFPVGYSGSTLGNSLSTDLYGNLYLTTRSAEEIHSFSPPNDDVQHDITTQSPQPLTDDLLLITLDSFTATAAGVGSPVHIKWSTSAEIDNTGFNVDRVQFSGGSAIAAGRVNAFPIPAAGINGGGADYSLVDNQPIAAGEDRGYILTDIDANGTKTTHGPIRVQIGANDPAGNPEWMLY